MPNFGSTLNKPQFFHTDGIQFFLSIGASNAVPRQKFNPRDFRKGELMRKSLSKKGVDFWSKESFNFV
jgi:hypothetical protein